MKPGDWKHLVGIFLLALLLRLGMVAWAQHSPPTLLPDEEQYLAIARHLTFMGDYQAPPWGRLLDSLQEFVHNPRPLSSGPLHIPDLFIGTERFIQHMPLYPLVLSGLMRLHGDMPLLQLRLLQAFIGSLSCLVVYLLAAEFFEGRARLFAGWLAAVWPFWIFFTSLVLTETLFIFLLLLTWYVVVRMVRSPNFSDMLMAGLLAGAAVLTRGSALALFFLLVPLLVVLAPARRLRVLAASLGLLLVCLITISPWVARNYAVTRSQDREAGRALVGRPGHLVLTTCSVGRSLYEAVGPEADGGPAMDRISVPPELVTKTEFEVDRWYWDRALDSMRQHPLRVLKLAGVKLLRTWNPVPNFVEYRRPFYLLLSAASFIPVVVLALFGWVTVLKHVRQWLLLILPVVYFTLVHMVFVGSVRYRLPLDGFVFIFAGLGLAYFLSRRPALTVGTAPDSGG